MIPHILVLDDNRDLTEDIREIFEQTGARVTVLEDAHLALKHAKSDPYDLALIDVRLPTPRSSLALLPQFREASPDGEVVVMTGSATVHSAMEAVRHGVFAYLSKPFDPVDLLRLAERALEQVELRRERTLLSRELARSEALHRAVFDTVGSLIVGIDAEHRVRLWNASAAQTTGRRSHQTLGEHACDLLVKESHREKLHDMVMAAGVGTAGEARLPVTRIDGEERVVHWHVRPLASAAVGGPQMVLLAGNDLTERLEAEARAASAEAFAALGKLTSALAHEIRNPLNAATLQLELLRRGADKAGHEAMERRAVVVADELSRLTSLLDDFLGLARPKHLAMAGVDPVHVAWRVYELHEPSAREAGVKFSVQARGEVPQIHADEGRIRQALTNLVVNAIDATAEREGGEIEIRVGASDGSVVLAVCDDGTGLPEGQRILEPFETTKEGGTGLGLPIVKRIAQMHGGSLSIQRREDGPGTVAAITLPIRDGAKGLRGTS